jgi:amino acid permease
MESGLGLVSRSGLKIKFWDKQFNLYSYEFQSLIVYVASFFANIGNYKSFGDTKFIPGLSKVLIGISDTQVTFCLGDVSHLI